MVGNCGACKTGLHDANTQAPLCLTKCGHMFHTKCIFVEEDNNQKLKVLACPTCRSRRYRPVIRIFPTVTEKEVPFANPAHQQSLLRSVPKVEMTEQNNGRGVQVDGTDIQIHSCFVSDFNELLKKVVDQEKQCHEKIANNSALENEIAALKQKIEQQKKEISQLLKRDSSGEQRNIAGAVEEDPADYQKNLENKHVCVDNIDDEPPEIEHETGEELAELTDEESEVEDDFEENTESEPEISDDFEEDTGSEPEISDDDEASDPDYEFPSS